MGNKKIFPAPFAASLFVNTESRESPGLLSLLFHSSFAPSRVLRSMRCGGSWIERSWRRKISPRISFRSFCVVPGGREMDDDGGLGIRNWGYYEQPIKNNLGLQLMPTMTVDRDTKPLLPSSTFLHRDCGIAEPSIPLEFGRDGWMHHRDKIIQMLPGNHHSYAMLSDASGGGHALQMLQQPDQCNDVKLPQSDEPKGRKVAPLKKKPQGCPPKVPKTTKPKKVDAGGEEGGNGHVPRGRSARKNTEVVINGIDLDISSLPTPVCTCTGTAQPCYRWGVGGWQSACCTTNISMHPLPMSTKRRGSRIPGRKMSHGAFKKVLEKLAGEGYNLSNPIDLRRHWAKHGTNKFVTIR